MKKVLTALLFTGLLLSVTGCKKDSSGNNKVTQDDSIPAELKKDIVKEAPEVFNMITVKGGWFNLGIPENEFDESYGYKIYQFHKAYVSDFMISSSEITQNLYEEIMEANPSIHVGKYKPVEIKKIIDIFIFCNKLSEKENLTPCYSWNGNTDTDTWDLFYGKNDKDFYKFMTKLNCDFSADGYRIPTETEWMYAARGGNNQEKFKHAGSDNLYSIAVSHCYSEENEWIEYESPLDVKSKLPNSLGLYDMSGNVDEFVWDYYNAVPFYDVVNYTGPARDNPSFCTYGVVKGGSYCYTSDSLEAKHNINLKEDNLEHGFRVCRTLSSTEITKNIEKAQKIADEKKVDLIKKSIYSKLIEIPSFSYKDGSKEKNQASLLVTKLPLTEDDIFLLSENFIGSYYSENPSCSIYRYNAARYLNELSISLGLEPCYKFGFIDDEKNFIELSVEELRSQKIDFKAVHNDYDEEKNTKFETLLIKADTTANGFRLLTYTEEKSLDKLTQLNSNIYSFSDKVKINLPCFTPCGLPAYFSCYSLNDNEEYHETSYRNSNLSSLYICRNLPEDTTEAENEKKLIAKYSEKARIEKLEKFETLLGKSLNTMMKEIKGGKALQSLDVCNANFKEVILGSYSMLEIPFTNTIMEALCGKKSDDSHRHNYESEQKNIPLYVTWTDAALICNNLSDLYNYKKVYTFNEKSIDIDYTADGFRLPTEAEWEHAARSGTTDKTIKYGVYATELIYHKNDKFFTLHEGDMEDYYEPARDLNAYSGEANGLGLYNLAGYCQEWCNDNQLFNSGDFDFSGKNYGYTVEAYDSHPYEITNMPFGQIYAPKKIVKSSNYYSSDVEDLRLSVRSTFSKSWDTAFRMVRSTNTEEMQKLISEHEKEYDALLQSNKTYFDEKLKMISVKTKPFAKRNTNGDTSNKLLNISDYQISETEITNEMFIRIMHYNPCINDLRETRHKKYNNSPDAPVADISLFDIVYFCNELSRMYGYKPFYNLKDLSPNPDADGFRLPSEHEWLFAAMEGNPKYKMEFSGGTDKAEVGVFNSNHTEDVKQKKPNHLGIYDMSGNVAEFVHPVDNHSEKPFYDRLESKGGSFYDEDTIYEYNSNDEESLHIGFRIIRQEKQ